jgi:hypothetical protein
MAGISSILDKIRIIWASAREKYDKLDNGFADFFTIEILDTSTAGSLSPLYDYSDKELEQYLDTKIADLKEKNESIFETLSTQLDDQGDVILTTEIIESDSETSDIELRQKLCIVEGVHSITVELLDIFTPETLESLARQLQEGIFNVRQKLSRKEGWSD